MWVRDKLPTFHFHYFHFFYQVLLNPIRPRHSRPRSSAHLPLPSPRMMSVMTGSVVMVTEPILGTPSAFPREDGVFEAAVVSFAAEATGCVGSAWQGDVVVPPIPDGGVYHAVSTEGGDGADYCAGDCG